MSRDVRLAADTVPPEGLSPAFGQSGDLLLDHLPAPRPYRRDGCRDYADDSGHVRHGTLRSGDLLKAVSVTAASVTGPTNDAATAAIVADSVDGPRALNAFEVGVVGLLRIVPAAAGGLPGIVTAIQDARQDTFTALNAPIVPNPAPTVMPVVS